MPSDRPVIALRLRPHVHEVFSRLAELQGRPKSAVIAEILETVYEPMMRTIALLEAARDAPREVRDGLRATVEELERDLVHTAGGSLAQMDWLIERAREGSKLPPEGGSTPVPVTRGSGRVRRGGRASRKGGVNRG